MSKLNQKKTGYEWTVLLNLKFTSISGFKSEDFYQKVKISKEDFLNYACNCELEKPIHQTRQEASKLKKLLSLGIK